MKELSNKPWNAISQRFLLAQGLVNDALRVFSTTGSPLPDGARAGGCKTIRVA